jgi:hypothetical protein
MGAFNYWWLLAAVVASNHYHTTGGSTLTVIDASDRLSATNDSEIPLGAPSIFAARSLKFFGVAPGTHPSTTHANFSRGRRHVLFGVHNKQTSRGPVALWKQLLRI